MTILQIVFIFIAGLIAGIAITLMSFIRDVGEISEYQTLRAKYDALEHELIWYKTNNEKLCDMASTLFNITDFCIDKQIEAESKLKES